MRTRSLITAGLLASTFLLAPRALAAQEMAEGDDLTMKLASIEQSLWAGWENADAAPFEKNMVESSISVGPWGIQSGKAEIMAEISDGGCEVAGYSFSDWKVHKVGDGTAILTYSATQDAVCDGQTVPASIVVSSTYVMHGDHWMSASYHETPVESQ